MAQNSEKPSTSVDQNPDTTQQAETAQTTRETQAQLQWAETGAVSTDAKNKLQKALPFETANVLSGTKHTYEYIKNTSLSKDIVTATKDMPEYKELTDEQRVEKYSDNIDKIWFLAIDTIIDNPDISQAEIRNMASWTSIAFMKWYNWSDASTKKTLDDFLKYWIWQAPQDSSDKKNFLSGLGGIFWNLFRGFGANSNFKNFINKNMLVAKSVDRLGKSSFLSSPEIYSDMLSWVFSKELSDEWAILDHIEKNFYNQKFSDQDISSKQPEIKLIMEQTGWTMTPEMLQRLSGLWKYFQVVESWKNTIKNMLSASPILDSLVWNLYAISTGQPLSWPLSWLSSNPMGQEIMNTLKPIAWVAMPLVNYVFKFMGYKTDMPAWANAQEWAKTHPFGSVEAFLADRNQNYLLSAEARDRISETLTGKLKSAESSLRTWTIFSDANNLDWKLDSDFVLALNRKLNVDFSDETKSTQQVLHFFSDSWAFSELKKSVPEGFLKNDENSNHYDLKKISLLTKWYFMEWDKSKTFEEFVKAKKDAVDKSKLTDDPNYKPSQYSLEWTEADDEDNASVATNANADQDSSIVDSSETVDTPQTDWQVWEKLVLNWETFVSNAKNFLTKPSWVVKNMIWHNFISSKNINTWVYEQCVRYAAFRTWYDKPMGDWAKVAWNLLKNYPSSFENVTWKWDKITPWSVISWSFWWVTHVCIVEKVDLVNKKIITSWMNEGVKNFNATTSRSDMAWVVRVQERPFSYFTENVKGLTIARPKNNSEYMRDFVRTGKEIWLLTKSTSTPSQSDAWADLPTTVSEASSAGNINYKYEGFDFENKPAFKSLLQQIWKNKYATLIYKNFLKFGSNAAKRAVIISAFETWGWKTRNPNAHAKNKENSVWLFQINLEAHAEKVPGKNIAEKIAWLKVPENNIKMAMRLYDVKNDFHDWTAAYKSRWTVVWTAWNGVMTIV